MKSRREFLLLSAMGTAFGYASLFYEKYHLFMLAGSQSPFLKACAAGDLETVKRLLLEDNQLLSIKSKEGLTGFAVALLAGYRSVADHLKDAGYVPDIHETALYLDWEGFEKMLEEESVATVDQINAHHPMGGSVMWAAAAGGAGSNIWRVYAKCGDPNILTSNKRQTSVLQAALRFTDLRTAEMTAATLLGNDADPNLTGKGDMPPLHIAAARGSYEIVEMLIRLGAKVELKDKKGMTATQHAEKNGFEKVWNLLNAHQKIARTSRSCRTAYTADGQVYQVADIGEIPLYKRREFVGQAHGNLEYVQKALKSEPRLVHAAATTSEICVEACAHTGRKAVVEHLLNSGAPYSLPTAVLMNDFTTVKRLLDEDPNRIHARGAHDFGLLWYPIIGRCELDMIQLLLDRGAKVEDQHYLGTTALHWASIRGPIELIELLIANGADVNRVGRKFKAEGQTPLQMARDEKVANYLRSKGAP